MEYKKITNSLANTSDKVPRFITKRKIYYIITRSS